MKRNYLLFLCVAFLSINSFATNYTSAQNGNWMSFTTWSPMGVPIPGDIIVINHAVTLDTSFAYTVGSITVNASGSLIQDLPVRDIWVNGPNASLTNNGMTTIRNLLLSVGSFSNSGDFQVKSIANYLTANNTGTGVIMGVDSMYNNGTFNNDGNIRIMTFYNDNTINNYGTIQGLTTIVDSMYNAGTFLNDAGALLKADSCTNSGTFTNNGIVNYFQFTNAAPGTFTNTNYMSFVDMTNFGTFTNQDSIIGTGSVTNTEIFDHQAGAVMDIAISFLNVDTISSNATFTCDGWFNIGDSYYNFDIVNGASSGNIIVQDSSYNSGTMSGSFDFCDLTPPATSPYIDFNLGTVAPTITYCVGVGVDSEVQSSAFSIYPNPTTGILNIELADKFTVDVYTILGEIVLSTSNSKIDISAYQNGVYFVLLKDEVGGLIKQEKVIKY